MRRIDHIIKTFDHTFPKPSVELNYSNPLELLVATILSARCTDQRVNQVTARLFKKYKKVQDYAQADPDTLEQEIRSTGFYKNKARNIIRCCQELTRRFSSKVPQTMEELTSLPGVWRKTASVIIGNCFGQPAIVVDTHVLRVSRRLGLTQSDDPDTVEEDLAKILPPKRWVRISHQMVLHGRYICKAKHPLCDSCELRPVCLYYQSR
jgi:endonuclease III